MKKTKILSSCIVLILGVASLIRTTFLLWNSFLPDFSVFYYSSFRLFHGLNPYTNVHLFTQINYPPITLMLFYPLLIFPFFEASKFWILISILFFILCMYLIKKNYSLNYQKIGFIFFLSVMSFPFKFTLGMGQINIVLLFLILYMFYFLNRKKDKITAILFSLAISIKLIPAIFAIGFFFLKRWKILLIALISSIFLFFIPDLVSHRLITIYYLNKVLLPLVLKPAGSVYYNQSITGFLSRIGMPSLVAFLIRIFLIALTILKGYKSKEKLIFAETLFLTGFMTVNSFTWQHQLILLVIPFCYFLSQKLSLAKNILLLVLYVLLAVNIKNTAYFGHTLINELILSHGFFGLFGIWILLILEKPIKLLKTDELNRHK